MKQFKNTKQFTEWIEENKQEPNFIFSNIKFKLKEQIFEKPIDCLYFLNDSGSIINNILMSFKNVFNLKGN